ncbi:ester cyclase [Spirillospora sp. NPDC029432]|uniref:ester cyclase n=1 Tax=Spirillospora sp. NPDC029432 TaxID=3154599 RepID=UPI0034556C43
MLTGKVVVQRLVTEVLNGGHLELVDQLYAPAQAEEARAWIGAFRTSFPDVHMDIVELIAEPAPAGTGKETVVGRFTCSGTHTGTWRGHPPTGRRFENIDEVGIYRITGGRITDSWTLEDTLTRLRHLALPAPDAVETRS